VFWFAAYKGRFLFIKTHFEHGRISKTKICWEPDGLTTLVAVTNFNKD